MAQVHTVTAGPTSGIQEERLSLFETIQDFVEFSGPRSTETMEIASAHLPVREEHPSTKEYVRFMARKPLETLKESLIHAPSTELSD